MPPLLDALLNLLTNRVLATQPAAEARSQVVALAGLTPAEAYKLGRTEGFWEGASTLIRSGLVQLREPMLPRAMRTLVEHSH